MKKIIKVKKYEKTASLGEIYQKSGLVYAFLSAPRDGTAQCHPFVKCRDFLHDAVRAAVNNNKVSIYGFKYDPNEDPKIDLKRTRLLLRYPDLEVKKFATIINTAVKLLHHYENMMGLKVKTSIYKSTDGDYIVTSSNVWLKSPILTSTFSLLFRIAELQPEFDIDNNASLITSYKKIIDSVKDIKHKDNKDVLYLSKIYDRLHIILENYGPLCNVNKSFFSDILRKEIDINNYHNNTGIISLCSNTHIDKTLTPLLDVYIEVSKEMKKFLKVTSPFDIGIYKSYQPQTMHMALVNSVDDKRNQVTQFNSCRESVISYYRTSYKKFDNQKIRLLVHVPGVLRDSARMNTHKKEFFFAKKVLNFYENKFGIKRSVISTVAIQHKSSINYAWLFTGDPEWLSTPVMLSTYAMIIRAAKRYMYNKGIGVADCDEIKKIDNSSVEKMWKVMNDKQAFGGWADIDLHVKKKEFDTLMLNRKKVFGDKTIEQAYYVGNENKIGNNVGNDYMYFSSVGINRLLHFTHVDPKLVKTFKEIMAKNE